MDLGEKLGDFYRSMEDKYYEAVDWLEEKGISLYPIIDKIEENNIPSFPVAIALAILVLAILFFGIGMLVAPQATVAFTVTDAETGLALEGAEVTVTSASGSSVFGTTDSEGMVKLSVPAGEIEAEISAEGYETTTVSLNVSGASEKSVELDKGTRMLSKTIQLLKTGTTQLMSEEVTVKFTCSNLSTTEFEVTKNAVAGTINLDVPSNCGSLIATPLGSFSTPNGIIDIQEASPQLFLQETETNTGTINVSVENMDGEAISGITAMVYSSDGLLAGTQYTSAAGTAVFDDIATGRYYILIHDSQGRYADYDSSMEGAAGIKELSKDASISFEATLSESVAGTIKVLVKDSSTQLGVRNATIYLKKEGLVVDTAYTDTDGVAEFNVGENAAYGLEVDADGYLIAVVSSVTAGESYNEIYLEAATSGNTQVLAVEVLDSRQKPIDNVRLVLKKSDGTIYANNVVTGADGTGEFTNLPLDTYYVYAVKKGFEGKNSDPITIRARQDNKLTITLPIGFGNLEVHVLNDELQPVQGAIVEAMNSIDEEKEQEEITDLEGKAIFNFRADKKVFFKVDAEGFLPYYSMAVMPDADSTLTTEIVLAKDPGQLEVKLLGLYQNGSEAPKELSPGAKYTARLLLLVPKGSHFEEAGIHIRTGNADEGKTNIMEEDSIYLKNIYASTASVLRGTSFTPPKGYATDSTHLTTGDSKWANITWKNTAQGAYALEAEVQVSEAAPLGQLLYISYRGWGKEGSYARYPGDAALGAAESTGVKQALYANAKQRAYTAGPSSLCASNFCRTLAIEDISKNLRVDVSGQYGAVIGSTYRLHFLISSTAEQAFTNAQIEFSSRGDGLRFGSYAITDATGLRSEGNADGYSLLKSVGDMRKESSVFGYVDFMTEKEGSNPMSITIKSNNQAILTETVDIRVEAAEQLQLDVIPKEIIPMIDNEVLARVTDESGEPVSNAIITVTIDGTLVLATESNGSGEIEFKLEAPPTGSELVIKAEKQGYKAAELKQTIDNDILSITPPEINERLDIALNEVENQIWFNNQTVTSFIISKLKFSSDFEDMVEFEWDDDYIGTEIGEDSDVNVFLITRLTEKGTLVTKPVKLEGSLSIYILSPELEETFVENLPITIRISQGGDVDNDKCLEIMPTSWEAITASDKTISQEFMLKNNCKVDGVEVGLTSLLAKAFTGNENSLGRFTLSSEDLEGAEVVMLGEEYADFAEVLPAGFEGIVQLDFTPNSAIDSGSAEPSIEFTATHASSKGDQKIALKLPTEVHVSNLSKCVEVIAEEPITVETMPLNIGFGNYAGAYNPYYAGGYGGYSTGGYGYSSIPGSGGGYMGGSTYPYPNYNSAYYTNYYNTDEDDSWRYGLGENTFTVKNNCASAVEISLDVPSRIRADQEDFELSPNSDEKVTVESGYRMGAYEIGIFAKRKGSQDKEQKIDTIDVIVRRLGEMDEECIQLSTNKIKLSNFIGTPVKTSIFNYCYDVGVRLPQAGNVIQFNCKVAGQPMNTYRFEEEQEETAYFQYPQYANPFAQPSGYYNSPPSQTGMYSPGEGYVQTGPWGTAYGQAGLGTQGYNYSASSYPYGSNNWAYAQVGGYNGGCELIDSVYVTDSRTAGGEDGKTIQTVDFEVKPAINYRKMLCEFQSQMPFQSIYGLRVMLSQAYYRVHVDAAANVQYYNPFGGSTNKYFQVTLEDMWGIGDTIDECWHQAGLPPMTDLESLLKCKEKGKAAEIDAIINKSALDLTTKGYAKGFLPQELFNNGDTYIYTTDPPVINIPPAGSSDSIVEITPRVLRGENGAKVYLEPVKTNCPAPYIGGNWNIKMTVDRSGMTKGVGCDKIEGQVVIKVKRPNFWSSEKQTVMPVKVYILNKGANINKIDITKCTQSGTLPPVSTECPGGGFTGDAYTNYGFDRLLFDWSWETIGKDTCDYKSDTDKTAKFCDAAQFSISLAKKAAEVKKFADKVVRSADAEMKAKIAAAVEAQNADSIPDEYKDSKNLFRWTKKQIIVKDNSQKDKEKQLVFFMKDEASLLDAGKLEAEAGGTKLPLVKDQDPAKEEQAKDIVTDFMPQVLESISSSENVDEESIVGLFDKNDKTKKYEDDKYLEALGIEYYPELEKYVWTYKEFKKFHENMNKALDKIGQQENKAENIEEAKTCFIEPVNTNDLPSAMRVAISFEMVKEIYKANLQFVQGVRDSKELAMDSEAGQKALNEAKDIAKPDGYASFAELYNKDINFSSYLMKDGYSSKLRQDAEKIESFDKTIEYSGNWEFKLESQSGDIKLPNAGLYQVFLNYNPSHEAVELKEEETGAMSLAESYKAWTVELEPKKTIGEIDKELGTAYADNKMFEMPIDGMLGEDGKRTGYGTSFSGAKETALNIAYKESGGENISTKFFDSTGGINNYSFSYGDKFAETNTGTILEVAGPKFQYNPSRPGRIALTLTPRADGGTEGILYEIVPAAQGSTSEKDTTIASEQSWFIFKQAASEQTFKDQTMSQAQAQTLCNEIGAAKGLRGFAQENPSQTEYYGIIYIPFKGKYDLQVICVQGNATISALGKTIDVPAGHREAGATGYSVSLNTNLNNAGITLESFIKGIETQQVCFVPTENGLKLTWHTANKLETSN